jgi:hypothetical protein
LDYDPPIFASHLAGITGVSHHNLVGCNFDLEYFQFICIYGKCAA